MTETEKKALALVKAVISAEQERTLPIYADKGVLCEALFRAIEQHEAFRQEVSDAVKGSPLNVVAKERLNRFIIAKPDPLVEVLQEITGEGGYDNFDHYAYRLRSALEARDLEIREKQ